MKAVRQRRGSVLLMAIGLLTIIAILASTFMIVSNLDAQEQLTLSVKDRAEPYAQGAVATVMMQSHDDYYWSDDTTSQPFAGIDDGVTGIEAWKRFIDTPGGASIDGNGNTTAPGDRIDRWLASHYDAQRHSASGRPIPISTIYSIINDSADACSLYDTDGDDIDDAPSYQPFEGSGQSDADFRLAVRVIDHGGLLCVNTAGENLNDYGQSLAGMPSYRAPVLVDLVGFLGSGPYARLHQERCNGGADSDPQDQPQGDKGHLRNYDLFCGRRLLEPSGLYRPFGIGDELFLRWCEELTEESIANVGRLAEMIGDDLIQDNETDNSYTDLPKAGDELKRKLTTFSCVSARLRHPDANSQYLTYLDPLNNSEAVFERAKRMIRELNLANGDEGAESRMAAHFTANLKAYLTPLSAAKSDWPNFLYTDVDAGKQVTAYGVKQDVIISEVFAKHFVKMSDDDDIPSQMWAWGCAVELMNPSTVDATTDEFELWVNNSKVNGLNNITIPAARLGNGFQKIVLWNFDQGEDEDGNTPVTGPQEFFGTQADPASMEGWLRVPGLRLFGTGDRKLSLRRIQGASFVVDDCELGPKGLNYEYDGDPNNPGGENVNKTKDNPARYDLRRDDRWSVAGTGGTNSPRARYNLGLWRYFETDHKLGEGNTENTAGDTWLSGGDLRPNANGIDKSALHSAAIYEGRQNPDTFKTDLVFDSIGDLCDVYFCGPSSDPEKGGFPQRVVNVQDSSIFADAQNPARGRLDALPHQVSFAGYTPGRYPDVPPGALFAEFFTHVEPHDARSGDKGRVYGQVNVNTATGRVLARLPWPNEVLDHDNLTPLFRIEAADVNNIVAWLLRYRSNIDRFIDQLPGEVNSALVQANLRNQSERLRAFLTPGEVGTALAAYSDKVLVDRRVEANYDTLQKRSDYVHVRNALYRSIADSISTRSDVFTVYVKVVHGAAERYKWHYIATFDRSNVRRKDQAPALLMFAPVLTWDDVADQNN